MYWTWYVHFVSFCKRKSNNWGPQFTKYVTCVIRNNRGRGWVAAVVMYCHQKKWWEVWSDSAIQTNYISKWWDINKTLIETITTSISYSKFKLNNENDITSHSFLILSTAEWNQAEKLPSICWQYITLLRDVTMGKFLVQHLRCWAKFAPLVGIGWRYLKI